MAPRRWPVADAGSDALPIRVSSDLTPQNSPTIVIGAGIVGCAVARELARRGHACTVIDPRPIGGGATQASAGMLAPYVEAHGGGPMLDLCVRSLDLYDRWIEGLRADGFEVEYRRIGTLEIALTESQAEGLRHGHGEWLDAATVAAGYPRLAPTVGALRDLRHGYVDAPALAEALAGSARKHGAVFESARVERIDARGDSLRVDLAADGEREAAAVVVAAGAWTSRIHGVRLPPLRPVRGQLLVHPGGVGRITTILWGPGCYIVPKKRGLLIGATVEDAGFDERPTPEGQRALIDAARDLLPGLDPQLTEAVRVGLRPAAPDDLPVIGADADVPGLFHATGHYRNGVLLAPVTATLLADAIGGGAADPALQHFRADRFPASI